MATKRRVTNCFSLLAENQNDKVEWLSQARWVDDGKVITSSGVSADIDMALHLIDRLLGAGIAEESVMVTEYVWSREAGNDPFHGQLNLYQ